MTVIVAGTQTAEGQAAHRFAIAEAARRGEDLLYFVLSDERPDPALAAEAGVTEHCEIPDARDRDAVGALLDTAEANETSAIVVGVRHRTPVGKLILGSSAQQIILQSNVPVICVKP